MAGENVVKIEFQADDASTTAAFSRLNAEVGNLGSGAGMGKAQAAMADWRKETGLAAQATITHGQAIVALGGHAGKTAADFKPATAEMRAASVAVEEVGNKAGGATGGIGAFRGSMRALRFDVFEVVAVLGLLVKSFDEAAKAEASQRHLANQGVSNVTAIKLEAAARDENFAPREYDDAAISLKVAGVSAKDLTTDVTELGKASRISDVPFDKLVDTAASMTEEFETGGIPTLAQMTTLTLASSGATQVQTDKYMALEKTLKLTEQAWKLQEEAQARSHKTATEQTSAIDSFAGKTGVAADAFKEFQARQTSFTGGFGTQMMGGEVMKQYSEGLSQLSKESGMGTEQIRGFMAAGKVGYEDLISASGRYRAHQQEEIEFTQKQRDEAKRLDTEAKERELGQQALAYVETPNARRELLAAAQTASPEGKAQAAQALATSAMVELGKVISKYFPELTIAMGVLAGVEVLSRLAAINSRFFPNLFAGKSGAGAAVSAEGEAAGAGAAAFKPPLWLAPIGYAGMTAEQNAMNAKDPGYSGANRAIGSAVGGWWNSLMGGNAAPKPGGANEPTTVQDPKMHELIGRLLQVFAAS